MKEKEEELLACDQEVAKELFQKELQVIVTDGVLAANEEQVEKNDTDMHS